MNKRLEANRQILKVLFDYIERDVDVRFFQALVNLNIVRYSAKEGTPVVKDDYFLESKETLKALRWDFRND